MSTQLSIAVLPFVNMSSDIENEYFSDGITEEIINALANIKNLKVISRSSSFFFKNKNIPIPQIGRQLKVSTILEGSVRLSGTMIRVTAQLVDAKNDFHFWSETWDRKLENVFETQDEISLLIAEKLRENFGHLEIQDRLVLKQTVNIVAYQNYLKGKFHYQKWNSKEIEKAIEYFEKALQLDPDHAESYLGLSDCYIFLNASGFRPDEESFIKVKKYVDQAMKLNDELPELYYTMASASLYNDWDLRNASHYANKAIELKPNIALGYHINSLVYMFYGKQETALKNADYALNLDPLSANMLCSKAYVCYFASRYDDSLKLTESCLQIEPKNMRAVVIKACCLLLLNKADELFEYINSEALNSVIDVSTQTGLKGIAYAYKKDQKRKSACLKVLHQQLEEDHAGRAIAYIFLIHAVAGDRDLALEWLQKGINSKAPVLRFLAPDPLLKSLFTDERYITLVKKIMGEIFSIQNTPEKKKNLLNDKQIELYNHKLLECIKNEKPYYDPLLSLKTLANKLEIHSNQLSWLLNESLGKNFSDFINYYRLEAFKKKAKNPANAHITLIGLAFESGFNSKTVFNTFFKKEMGITPKQYLNQ